MIKTLATVWTDKCDSAVVLLIMQGFRAFDPALHIPDGTARSPADLLGLDLVGLPLFPLYPVPLLSRQERSNI